MIVEYMDVRNESSQLDGNSDAEVDINSKCEQTLTTREIEATWVQWIY